MTYQQFPIQGPFGGFQDNLPVPHTPPNSFDEIRNFICRRGRLHTRPKLESFGAAPPDGASLRYMQTFRDIAGSRHTLALTTKSAYFLTSGPTWNLLTLPGGFGDLSGTALPYGAVYSQNRLYFSNGSTPVFYADGESSIKDSTSPGAFRFLAINANRLIGAYATEPEPGVAGSTLFPQRVRWSKSGDPTDWTSFGSGVNDLLDVPDEITGLATLGRNTIVLRENGLSLMTPTGIGTTPFAFENMVISPSGIGNIFPYSVGIYHDTAAFISSSDLWTVTAGLSLNPIGGKAKGKIFSQLEQVARDVPVGFILPTIAPGVPYLSYWLSIPGPDVVWVYHYDEDSWQEFTSVGGRLTFVGRAITE